ncbi:OB-fold nucleic acid binding domain-containing protein [Spirulina sp. 06S082]|uniref:helix-hairpin-helix domain-containing protein n=1 Tax=Spirulina sp. 06S082 TaxID=3110248 RepID=UPI002B1EFDE7|nr:OB-fold nucleic acid binding domain-containing protein [Spirulina sp. 06S082]MEA5471865.1 OB-fold nucleic acid binding domain-containing protein [Spirulina sp. 06S082]
MVKIIKRKSLGLQPVYDIGVEGDHNFLLESGLIAANCFNKSHSTAYAYVTYQTAYLKANYPTEYMAALLTGNSGNKDKIKSYIARCIDMGINVSPPDINRSNIDFTPVGKTILFGLSAVPNLGDGAIESILIARKENKGEFKSFSDFCSIVDLRTVNRRTLETLIHCGAFDKINENRNQLVQSLDPVISWAQKRAKERTSGQMNLFDILGGGTGNNSETKSFDTAPVLAQTADFSPQERLKKEKEILGFYVSANPLNTIKPAVDIVSPVSLAHLEDHKRQKISAIALISAVKTIMTKKGDAMAFLQLEDLTGQAEGVVFPSAFGEVEEYLQDDARLIFWGKAESKDGKVQFIVESVAPVEDVRMIMVELTVQEARDRRIQNNLKSILQQQAGNDTEGIKIPVVARIGTGPEGKLVRLDRKFWVQNDRAAVTALNNANYQARSEYILPH